MTARYLKRKSRTLAVIVMLSLLGLQAGCGDDPSRDAGQIDMATAKANSGASAEVGKVNPKAKVQSKESGRARPEL